MRGAQIREGRPQADELFWLVAVHFHIFSLCLGRQAGPRPRESFRNPSALLIGEVMPFAGVPHLSVVSCALRCQLAR